MRELWKPGTVLYPVPVVMVSCGDFEKGKKIFLPLRGREQYIPTRLCCIFP